MRKFDLSHAKHEPSHCLAPGLFRSLKKGERKTSKLHVVYEFGKENLIEFKGPEPLGADDMRVLQGLVALAGPTGKTLLPETETGIGMALREGLRPKWNAVKEKSLVVIGSYRQLAREIGYRESDTRRIAECIERLWTVSIIVQSGSERRGFHLLSHYSGDKKTDGLCVALNPMLSEAVLGQTRHVRIVMSEVRALKNDISRLVHQRLCGFIDPGKNGRVETETVCGYVWADGETAGEQTRRQRKSRVRRAIMDLVPLGWRIEEYAKDKWLVVRPEAKPVIDIS